MPGSMANGIKRSKCACAYLCERAHFAPFVAAHLVSLPRSLDERQCTTHTPTTLCTPPPKRDWNPPFDGCAVQLHAV